MKINKKLLVITTIIILLPIIIGLVFWEQLPETMATHWGTDNQPNGWNSKAFTVFGIPGIMAALHVFCLIITYADPKKSNIGAKAMGIVYWILPAVSVAVMSATYAYALGMEVNIGMICCLLMGCTLDKNDGSGYGELIIEDMVGVAGFSVLPNPKFTNPGLQEFSTTCMYV